MYSVLLFTLFALCAARTAKLPDVEEEYLDMLRATGQDEEFARLMGIDVSLVRPQEGRSEEDLIFTKVSDLGDILLTPEQEEQSRNSIRFDKYGERKWPNGKIPYVIPSGEFSTLQRKRITDAIDSFNSRSKNLQIVPWNSEKDYVMVINGDGCWSSMGRTGGRQALSLQSYGCLDSGTIQHEFIHAAGFAHEHNRPDRDDYVEVLYENIPKNWYSLYEKSSTDAFENRGKYDYYSVMHYPMYAPDTYKPAFKLLDSSINPAIVGQAKGPTDRDIQKVDSLYS